MNKMFTQTYYEKYSEDIENDLKSEWPRITEYNMLWHNGYYDGPIDGILDINGEKCKFFQIAESNGKVCKKFTECDNISPEEDHQCYMDLDYDCTRDIFRYYAIVPLTDDQYKEYRRWQDMFEKFVGNHNTYPARNLGTFYMKPQPEWDKFYHEDHGQSREIINFENSYDKIIGWFV